MLAKLACFSLVLCSTNLAQAQFAVAPYDNPPPESEDYPPHPSPQSAVRARVGPALRVAEESTSGGLMTGLDFGRHSGLRLSATWTTFGKEQGLGQYGGDLWLVMAEFDRVRPVVGAGAAVVHQPGSDDHDAITFGVATVRAALEYQFPLQNSDARASLEALGAVPAIAAESNAPWVTFSATLALGF